MNWFSIAWNLFLDITGIAAWLKKRSDVQEGIQQQRMADLQATVKELKAEDEAARDVPHGKAETIEALKHGDL